MTRTGAQKQTSQPDNSADTAAFDQLLDIFAKLILSQAWDIASDTERRVLLDELVEAITVGPEFFSVAVCGSPPVRIRYGEVGLKDSGSVGVGGASLTQSTRAPWSVELVAA